jgi:hypothetical protein
VQCGIWISASIYWKLSVLITIDPTAQSPIHSLQFTIARTKSSWSAVPSPTLWYRLPTADIPFPLGSRTVPVPQPPTVSRLVSLGVRHPSGTRDQFLSSYSLYRLQALEGVFKRGVLSDERSRPVVYSCCSASPAQYFSGPSPTGHASELYRPSDHRLSATLVSTFAHRGCHVVSLTYPLCPYSRLSRPKPLLFLPSSFSIVLTQQSGPHSRSTTSEKIW